MKLRTITQLNELQADDLDGSAMFAVSQKVVDGDDPQYTSKKVSYKTIHDKISSGIINEVAQTYNLSSIGGEAIDVSELKKTIDAVVAKDTTLYGVKTFYDIPRVAADYDAVTIADNMVPTVKQVKSMVLNNGDYITSDMVVVGQPGNNVRYTAFDRNFMHWKIGENQKDSSEYIDTTGYPVGPKVCTHTGNLVIYGWLADGGDVEPQDAWVGLYGCMHTGTEEGNARDWVLLQLQPWPLTSKSSVFQYVGFNVKVAKGMMLKIKTGFRVKGKNSGFQGGSSLTYWTNQPNSFVGYFITTADEYSAE